MAAQEKNVTNMQERL